MEGIMTSLGRGAPGLAGAAGKGYISYQLEGKHISVGKQYAGHKMLWLYRDYHGFRRASIESKCLASYGECLL
jgi:hypothetical protein